MTDENRVTCRECVPVSP